MKIDERIKAELTGESERIDAILNQREGMVDMVMGAFSAGLGRWVVLLNIIILIVTGVMFWTGYEFFTATALEERVYWGVCVVLAGMVQIAGKQWVMQEMSRGSLLREIKRVEVAVERLAGKLEQ
ncbi:DUF6768 family protein [Simiduia aestuariiviva]|uniref:Peptidoglycan biosynthesis protein MviN/MurJ (Putative lipid II flippase) n=1 Tax=Simiduia aestuariiviva TaxID=1510459 RepID=A0A839UR88_9GAMM|nr:DUF6768 family protein [Simiduia aestuariiviva]MBB3167895.1 peptidoglycan biosynthesis protein MviN/MurJ (putative lipid II flippase) [Simiduia aestuariiviva]